MAKHDNKTYEQKVRLRQNLRRAVEDAGPAVVVETHGGWGRLWQRVYPDLRAGAVFENDPAKAAALAAQRPTWAVYEAKAEAAIASGVGMHLAPSLFDLDPYGEPWPVFEAICAQSARWAPRSVGFVVNDGLRQKLQTGSGWAVGSMATAVAEFGNHNLYKRYLDVCKWLVTRAAARVGRRLEKWTAYPCGSHGQMTHYAFVLA